MRLKSLCAVLVITAVTLLKAVPLLGEDTDNPCANWAPSDKTVSACRFLVDRYVAIDNRCGIKFGHAWWKFWGGDSGSWKVIPADVLRDLPASVLKDSTGWRELQLPAVARLMTLGFPDATIDAAIKDDISKIESTDPDAKKNPEALYFDPMIEPAVMLEDGWSEQSRTLSCSNALTASENGNVKLPVVSASEKFARQESSTTTTRLAYGMFLSPMSWTRRQRPNVFYFEALDWYRNYVALTGNDLPDNVSYLSSFEGLVVYDAMKGSMSTDASGSMNASYGAPIGSVEGSIQGSTSNSDNASADIFHALIRKTTWSQLPQPADTTRFLEDSGAIEYSGANGKNASYNKMTRRLEATFSIPGLPTSLCKVGSWKLVTGTAGNYQEDLKVSLSAPIHHKAQAASGNKPAVPPECTWTVDEDAATASADKKIESQLQFATNVKDLQVTLKFSFKYEIDQPALRFLAANTLSPNTGIAEAQVWYQVQQPELLDTSEALELTAEKLTCDGKDVSLTGMPITIAVATAYPATASATIGGTFIRADIPVGWGETRELLIKRNYQADNEGRIAWLHCNSDNIN